MKKPAGRPWAARLTQHAVAVGNEIGCIRRPAQRAALFQSVEQS